MSRMQSHPDFRWPELERQREAAQAAARPAVTLSNPMLASDGEDVYSAVCGSLGPGIGAIR